MLWIATNDLLEALAAVAVQAGGGAAIAGPLKGAKIGLYTNQAQTTPETTYDFLTPPAFTGYAEVAVTAWTGPILEDDGTLLLYSNSATFIATGGTPSDTVYGVQLNDGGAPPKLLAAALLDSPVHFSDVGNGCVVVARIGFVAVGSPLEG
jgi:hypothetical protein